MARILFISHMSDLGGPPYVLLRLLKYVSQHHDVAVVLPRAGQLFKILEGMRIYCYQAEPEGLTRHSIPWLGRLIWCGEFDLVYGNGYSSASRNALIAAKLTGRPFVWHIHEIVKSDTPRRKASFLRFADLLIAVSQASAQSVRPYVPSKTVHVVHNGIELDDFQVEGPAAREYVRRILNIPQDHLVIVNAGLVCARKGQAYGVAAAYEILKDHPKATFAFLGRLDGESEYARPLVAQAAQTSGKIQFLGVRHDVPVFLLGCDVFLHTAAWDPFPIVGLEAMAAGLPAVAFAVDGLKEQVVDGETGYLIPFGDVSALVKALKECLENPSLRRRMGEAGRRRVETMFTAEETARRITELIHNIID